MITAPTQLSNCQVWLDASDTTSLFQLSGGTTAVAANLDPVGYWGDKSGNTRHFTNIGGSATTRPTWVSSLSTIRFDGSNDYLSSFFNLTYTAQTVFVVVSQRVGVLNARIFTQVSSGGADSASPNYIPCLVSGLNSTQVTSYHNGSNRSSVSLRSLSAFDIFSSSFSSTSATSFINGSSGSPYGSTLNVTTVLSRIGATAPTVNTPFNGDISEVIVYNRALTNNERADVEYYLTRKWNFLNSIPRQTYAIKNGLWSDSATWSISAEPSPWNFPLSADNAYTNTFTVTADSSTKVDTIRNSTLAPNILSGGSFVLANGVSLSANVLGGVAPFTLTLNPAASSTLVGNITGGLVQSIAAVSVSATSVLTLIGNCYCGTSVAGVFGGPGLQSAGTSVIYGNLFVGASNYGGSGMYSLSGANTTVYGKLIGASGGPGGGLNNALGSTARIFGDVGEKDTVAVTNNKHLLNNSGVAYVVGNVYCVLGPNVSSGIFNTTTGVVFVTGDIFAGSSVNRDAPGISNSGNGAVNIVGNIYANSLCNGVVSSSTAPLSVYGSIINAPNGVQSIYAPKYLVFPSASATYTRQAVNGYDSYTDYWTSNATFTYPASSNVASGTTYSNNTLSGSMAVPSASSVALGALVGISTGTASMTIDSILSQPIANLTTSNSIGARLKNITTSQALSSVVNSLNFSN